MDINDFKRQVKIWMRQNPKGTVAQLEDLIDELIPTVNYPAYHWLSEQTVAWFRHALEIKKENAELPTKKMKNARKGASK